MYFNLVRMKGKVTCEPEPFLFPNVKTGPKSWVIAEIEIPRSSGQNDYISVVCRAGTKIKEGDSIAFVGHIESYYSSEDSEEQRLKVIVVADYLVDKNSMKGGTNEVEISGMVFRKGVVRETPLSKRIILDFMLDLPQYFKRHKPMEKRGNGYQLPCIVWDEDAKSMDEVAGDRFIVSISGRLQSRVYEKSFEDGMKELFMVHEVSAYRKSIQFLNAASKAS